MKVIAFHVKHDASVAVAQDGVLLAVLELERLFGERYFASSSDLGVFERQWRGAVEAVIAFTGIDRFDVAVTSWVPPTERGVLKRLVSAAEWRRADHHRCHALHGHCDSPFERSLVLSFDGGGNDGTFRVFTVDAEGANAIARRPLNLGTAFRVLATTMPEVTGRRPQPSRGDLALAGKLMAYAALGQTREEWRPALVEHFEHFQEPAQALDALSEATGLELESDSLDPQDARDLAATAQSAFVQIVQRELMAFRGVPHDGLVLTGGCALNVVANEAVRGGWARPVHVPPAPNDAGISVGALWTVERPRSAPSVFSGLPLVMDISPRELERRGAVWCDVHELAGVIASGAVVGVAHDRAEHGPRALGHRSILALARDEGVRRRVNEEIKSREWYRPVAPVVRVGDVERWFGARVESPYMSFAPRVRGDMAARAPAARHVDGTARVQTTRPGEFLHRLLDAMAERGVEPVLVNTSFNVRARPLVHRASEALAALDETTLDHAWIEGWLVSRVGAHARASVERGRG